jgi:hypothetical protein
MSLTEHRPGGQRKLALSGDGSEAKELFTPLALATVDTQLASPVAPAEPAAPSTPEPEGASAELAAGERKQRAHLGLRIQFESRPDDAMLGRLVQSTIWVNDAHPAYQRAQASRQQGYHLAVTVAMTLAPLAAESAHVHEFVSEFLERWGSVGVRKGRG